jgi:hypothetical protein
LEFIASVGFIHNEFVTMHNRTILKLTLIVRLGHRLVGQEIGVELPDEAGDFSLLQSIQSISGAHPALY